MLKVCFVIIGTFIGAGFISGQEIYLFFNVYGPIGSIGLVIASSFLSYIIYQVLEYSIKNDIGTYSSFMGKVIKNKSISNLFKILVNAFILITFFIMIAGVGAYFEQEWGISRIIGNIIIAIVCYITFTKGIEGIVKVNMILMPFLIVLVIFLGCKYFFGINSYEVSMINVAQTSRNWFLSSILYAGYNSIILVQILISIKKYLKNKTQAFFISLISGIITFILGYIIYKLINVSNIDMSNIELPMVYIATRLGYLYKIIFGIAILIAIYTSAVSAGFEFIENTSKTKKGYKVISIGICVLGVIVGNISFSTLVSILYPIFGYLGVIQIIIIQITKLLEKRRVN